MATAKHYDERLEQIAHTVFGELSDDQILQLLAERKQLEDLKMQYEAAQQTQQQVTTAQTERTTVLAELDRLNALITPAQPDDELIHLVEERKTWEEKLKKVDATLVSLGHKEENTTTAAPLVPAPPVKKSRETSAPIRDVPVTDVAPAEPEEPVIDKDFGAQRIVETALDPQSELGKYLEQIQANPETMGKTLDALPASAKRDKSFMLAVAEIDPAYAMHYADKDVLKKDEDFNVRVVSIKGKRSSGSVLAEMLPEARTEQVAITALKQDYRNIRYVLPQMAGYEEMMEKAKKATLEKVKELKDSVDVGLLVPKILQKDKAFMAQVEKIVPKPE
ncbi:MAG: hypothetical protein KBA91_02360 [Candidatus Moranbacteria bacterium]|nr:hypothetical protein [Candidatus Moranbacteria bacterium]